MSTYASSVLVAFTLFFAAGCGSSLGPTTAPPQLTSAVAPPPVARGERVPVRAVTRGPTKDEAAELARLVPRHVARCFEPWLATGPVLAERVAFDLAFAQSGKVEGVVLASAPLPEKPLACLRAGLSTLSFSTPRVGRVVVRLPIELVPPPKAPPEPVYAAAKPRRSRR